ncbi:alpha/beta fold hydrolase [Diaminobutyricibacter sp. McL0608]|uniref:alpha/beta fold hydrolase n=1 Tax=Leifsonia sp. McL0608 TaxID=3143537 RepID=UPI0031F32A0C
MVFEHDVRLSDGRTVRVYDTGAAESDALTVVWFHGSPQTGALLDPLLEAASARRIRLLSYARPGYRGSTRVPGRDVASAAIDVEGFADALGLGGFAVMGASGGGPHALACAALLPGRVPAAATFATLAPFDAGIDWFGGMASDGAALRAAVEGPDARTAFEETAEFDPLSFNDRDYATLAGSWTSLGADVGIASGDGPEGLITDDLAFVQPWGFEIADIAAPVLLAQGGDDRVVPATHAEWLVGTMADAELWLRPRDGHISILEAAPVAFDWLLAHAR